MGRPLDFTLHPSISTFAALTEELSPSGLVNHVVHRQSTHTLVAILFLIVNLTQAAGQTCEDFS